MLRRLGPPVVLGATAWWLLFSFSWQAALFAACLVAFLWFAIADA